MYHHQINIEENALFLDRSSIKWVLMKFLAIQLYVIVIIFVQHLYNLFCLLVTKNILLARKKTLSNIALLVDMGAAIPKSIYQMYTIFC